MSRWGSWLGTLVQQGEDILNELSSGVTEFVEAVRADAVDVAHVAQLDSAAVVQNVTRGIRALLSEDGDDHAGHEDTAAADAVAAASAAMRRSDSDGPSTPRQKILSRAAASHEALRRDPNTFCTDPTESAESAAHFATFCASFDFESASTKAAVADALATYPELRAMHATLVPAAVDDATFWKRYFARLDEAEERQRRRKMILEASVHRPSTDDAIDDVGDWGADDDDDALSSSAAVTPRAPAMTTPLDSDVILAASPPTPPAEEEQGHVTPMATESAPPHTPPMPSSSMTASSVPSSPVIADAVAVPTAIPTATAITASPTASAPSTPRHHASSSGSSASSESSFEVLPDHVITSTPAGAVRTRDVTGDDSEEDDDWASWE